MSKSTILKSILDSHSHEEDRESEFLIHEVRHQFRRLFDEHYQEKVLDAPVLSGSLVKGTSLAGRFDLDLVIPFSYYAFRSPAHMLDDLQDLFNNDAELDAPLAITGIYEQRVSVGLEVEDEETEIILDIDIVPGMERRYEDYGQTKDLILWDSEKEVEIVTNIFKQVEATKSRGVHYHNLVRLMKIWRNDYGDDMNFLKSFILELVVQKAVDEHSELEKGNLWQQLRMVLYFIRDKFPGVQLPDPGNPYNLVNGLLEKEDWGSVSESAAETLREIEKDEDQIGRYFPFMEE